MRSRYTAHVLAAIDYLWDTWSPEKRVRSSKDDIRDWATSCEWLALNIVETHQGQANDSEGLVSFIALFRQNGKLHEHHEISVFKRSLGSWCYVDHQ